MKRRLPYLILSASVVALLGAACSAEDSAPTDAAPAQTAAPEAPVAPEETAAADAAETLAEAPAEGDEPPASSTESEGEVVESAAEGEAQAASSDAVSAEAIAQYAALTGDAAAGARVYRQCMSCHVIEAGVNRVGPSLHGVIGRVAGSAEGFRYSKANSTSGVTWSEAALFVYLENPRAFVKGTSMAFNGVKDAQQRADLIAYIKAESN